MSAIEMSEGRPDGPAEENGSIRLNFSKSEPPRGMDTMSKSQSKQSIWRQRFPKLTSTLHPNAHASPQLFANKYFFRRPRLLQYYDGDTIVDTYGHRKGPANPEDLVLTHNSTTEDRGHASRSVPENLVDESYNEEISKAQRDWLNLFIDLLWVGMMSNISSIFVSKAFLPPSLSGSSWDSSFLQFVVLFLAAFRFWSYLRKFLNNFFQKDYAQSLFLAWELALALLFANQTPYLLDPVGGRWVIGSFMVAKGSFLIIEAVYCIYIPTIRREFFLTCLVSIPVAVLWGVALAVSWPRQAAFILPAVLLEGVVSAIIALPLGDWFLGGAPKKALDADNLVERLQNFFIIVLGEGVYSLVSENDWGIGLSSQVSYAIEALVIYYCLFWLFFTGDQTKIYINAVYRNKYTSLAFQLIHVLLFASILLLDSSIEYLLQNSIPPTTGPDDLSDSARSYALLNARWTISASLCAALLFMTIKAFLNRSLDPPGTLLVDSRYLRMAPRAVVCVVVMCLPVVNDIGTSTYLGTIMGMLQFLGLVETVSAMDKGAKLFEPKES